MSLKYRCMKIRMFLRKNNHHEVKKLYHTVLTWFGQKWSAGAEGRGHFSHAPTVSTYIFLYNSYLSRSIVDTYMQLIIALFMAGKLVKHNLMVKTFCGVFRDFHGQYLAHRNEKPIPKLQFRIFMNFLSNQNKF